MVQDTQQEAFAALISQHTGIVRKIATTYCRDAEDRADLMQEMMAQLWAAWPRYDASRPFTTWMYRVALNVAISHVRGVYRCARHFVPLADEHLEHAGEGVDHAARQQLAALETLIAALDPLNRALLVLYLDDRSHSEIAEVLGISASNVGTKISRLKQRLRSDLA